MSVYGENKDFRLVRCKDDAEWLKQRVEGVGGSDVAAVMGLSPWRTPIDVWLEKTGRKDTDGQPSAAMRFGSVFEPIACEDYKQRNPSMTVRRVNAVCQSITRPWAQASLDYEIQDHVSKTWGVLEIKTARSAKDWADGIPLYYQTQVLHYLSVTKRLYAHVHVFFRDTCEYKTYLVRPDAEDLQAVVNAVDDFWNNYVKADRMPTATGGDTATLANMYGDTGEYATPDDVAEFESLVTQYQTAASFEKAAKERKAEITAQLQQMAGDAKGIESDSYRVTVIRSNRTRLDSKRLQAEQPDIYAQYSTTKTQFGGIKIKEF